MMRTLLLTLSNSKRLEHLVTSNSISRRMARRFVAGEELEEALAAARTCNQAGMSVSLDHLGENFLNLRDFVRPRLRILGPRQPRRLMPLPFGGHAVAEF